MCNKRYMTPKMTGPWDIIFPPTGHTLNTQDYPLLFLVIPCNAYNPARVSPCTIINTTIIVSQSFSQGTSAICFNFLQKFHKNTIFSIQENSGFRSGKLQRHPRDKLWIPEKNYTNSKIIVSLFEVNWKNIF